jgi:hypothetical protein
VENNAGQCKQSSSDWRPQLNRPLIIMPATCIISLPSASDVKETMQTLDLRISYLTVAEIGYEVVGCAAVEYA